MARSVLSIRSPLPIGERTIRELFLRSASFERSHSSVYSYYNKEPGAHATFLTGSVPALRERDARLGGTCKDEDSFPLTDAGNSARRR
jgi:hypothetical protein